MTYTNLKYDSWNQLKTDISKDICNDSVFPEKRFVFRGQRNPNWPLKSSFDRMFGYLDYKKREQIENELKSNFKKYCSELMEKDVFDKYNDVEILTLGQHYGLPTRLLDWTYSIYIAAFFSFANNKSDEDDYCSIWIIDTHHEIWRAHYGVNVITSHIYENKYQRNQKAIFTINESPNISLEEYVKDCSNRCNIDGALTRVNIPFFERNVVLNDLDMMGINHMSLFSGFEGCAQTSILKLFAKYDLK